MNSGGYPQLPSGAPGESISFFFGSFWPSAAAAMPAPILPVSVATADEYVGSTPHPVTVANQGL